MKINEGYPLQIEHIHHLLNTSKTKQVYSFPHSDRFNLKKSFSPDKFYDLPSQFTTRPVTARRMQSSLERERGRSTWRQYLSSSLDEKDLDGMRTRTTTFGISREDYYRGRKNNADQLGPGAYNPRSSLSPKPFYIGQKLPSPIFTSSSTKSSQPNCASYIIPSKTYNKLSTTRTNGTPVMKEEYYPKGRLQGYDNKVPGPGSYMSRGIQEGNRKSYKGEFQRKKNYSTFGVGERMKNAKNTYLGPGSYNRFSQFGRSRF